VGRAHFPARRNQRRFPQGHPPAGRRDSGWFLATGAALVTILDRFTIRREEELLVALFGDAYERYRQCVRRWL
jgi:hypothetical protein